MSKLKAVQPKTQKPKRPFVLIYGAPGSKKTWETLAFPNTFYSDSEEGATNEAYTKRLAASGGMYFGVEQGSGDFDEVIDQVKALATEKHSYKTFALDSISKIFNTEITKEQERLGDKDAFGASKKPAVAKTKRLIYWLDNLDMNKLLIAHEKPTWLNDKQGPPTFDAYEKLAYELDLVLHIIRTGDTSKAFVKKSRLPGFEVGQSFEWGYKELSERFGKDIMETDSKPIILATAEQIIEVKKLLETIKLTDSTKDKWIAENMDNLGEVESEKVDGIIKHLKAKITPSKEDEDKPAFLKEKK